MSNPYESPKVESVEGEHRTEDIAWYKKVAFNQRVVCFFILAYLLLIVAQFVLPPDIFAFVSLGFLVFALVSLVNMVLLAARIHSAGIAVLYAILFFLPIINLILLLFLNSRATKSLRDGGYKVGLLGVSSSQFR